MLQEKTNWLELKKEIKNQIHELQKQIRPEFEKENINDILSPGISVDQLVIKSRNKKIQAMIQELYHQYEKMDKIIAFDNSSEQKKDTLYEPSFKKVKKDACKQSIQSFNKC
ncbi:hypothetical protein [Bacillus piscicola]|uniref:hypothetical protein n=1 Tax=Bacillus piscicola TaxID=1632684 RepID=UPI001F08EBAE|nr:hypothetical protein [Bacillus piscicola]